MIERIFETHINVQDLRRSMRFYEDVLGLALGMLDPDRRVAFYWVGGRNVSMLGLWETPSVEIVSRHFAFQISAAAFPEAIENLRRHDIAVYNFLHDGSSQPMVFAWMPATSIYFRDPDGHELEYIAPLPDAPRPEVGVVSICQWDQIKSGGAGRHARHEQLNEIRPSATA